MSNAPWVEMFGLTAPYGKCQCGCGRDAPVAKTSRRERGDLRGEPIRFIRGHTGSVGKNASKSLIEAYSAYVVAGDPDSCWLWQGYLSRKGYGYVTIHYKDWIASRLSYTVNYGPIPEGIHVCHRCDNPACVNPNHLFLGTHQDNMNDKVAKGRQPRGEHNSMVKLDDEKVARIKHELAFRTESNSAIAKRYGVGRKTIDAIEHGRNWAHIPGPPPTRMGAKNLPTGMNHPNAKLTDRDLVEIRYLLQKGLFTQRAIAHHYGVAETLISQIKLGHARNGACTSCKELTPEQATVLITLLETELRRARNGKVTA